MNKFAETLSIRRGRRLLAALELELARNYQATVQLLRSGTHDPRQVVTLEPVLVQLATLIKAVGDTKETLEPSQLLTAQALLRQSALDVMTCLQTQPDSQFDARRVLTFAMQALMQAETEFHGLVPSAVNAQDSSITEVRVPTDLLYQCWNMLFPAERMLIIAGRRREGSIALGAVFDVTGTSSAVGVRADASKMAQALIAMTASGTHLAAWFHSHPGAGPLSTHPSGIDQRQHADWLRDYSPLLLDAIFVRDRFIRFWGSSLQQGHLHVTLEGDGLVHVMGEEHVYQLFLG